MIDIMTDSGRIYSIDNGKIVNRNEGLIKRLEQDERTGNFIDKCFWIVFFSCSAFALAVTIIK